MKVERSPFDNNTYFLQGEDLFFCESTFDNRSQLIEQDLVPNSAQGESESTLTESQLYNIGTRLGLPLGRKPI